jgi:hypothetical protein
MVWSTYWHWNESFSNGDRNARKGQMLDVLKFSLQAWPSYQPVDVSEEHSDEGGMETPVWVAFPGKTHFGIFWVTFPGKPLLAYFG